MSTTSLIEPTTSVYDNDQLAVYDRSRASSLIALQAARTPSEVRFVLVHAGAGPQFKLQVRKKCANQAACSS